jgi:hypothetical protein
MVLAELKEGVDHRGHRELRGNGRKKGLKIPLCVLCGLCGQFHRMGFQTIRA